MRGKTRKKKKEIPDRPISLIKFHNIKSHPITTILSIEAEADLKEPKIRKPSSNKLCNSNKHLLLISNLVLMAAKEAKEDPKEAKTKLNNIRTRLSMKLELKRFLLGKRGKGRPKGSKNKIKLQSHMSVRL